jgi:hypothetical protein
MKPGVAFAACLAMAAVGYASQTKDVPSWVQEASSRALPQFPAKAPAAVLLDEKRVNVDASGLITTTTRRAVKVLTHEGQKEAVATEYYSNRGPKIKQLRAWLIAPSGFIKSYEKNDVMDVGAFSEMELYNDIRIRLIKPENPEIGSVFAYESEVEQTALFAQDQYLFQTDLPSARSRYVVTLPAGWTASGVTINHEPIQPIVDGSAYTWELRDLPFREREDHAPSMLGLAPRLAVDFRPPSAAQLSNAACFRSWTDVSQWHSQLSAGQDAITPEIEAKARELTAHAPTEYAKIQAISEYVQKIKYVAILMDLAHGAGYKPHAAGAVFHHQYGDCKDKANLMRSMLKAVGIQSYLVAIYAEDRTFVHDEWPSPKQFNHMIVAVRVSDATEAPTIIGTKAGRLLLFDPTDVATPLGDLPWFEQGSFALLCAGDQGALLKMPSIKPDASSVEVTVEGTLTPAGDLSASYSSKRTGQLAAAMRGERLYSTPDEFRVQIERALSRTIKSASISNLDVQDAFEQNAFHLKLDFASQRYAQLMQQRLLVFSPSVLEPPGPNLSHSSKRTAPIMLRGGVYRKHVRIKLPPGFTVDEMPDAAKMDEDFARFSVTFRQEAGDLIVEEELTTEPVTLPAEDYRRVKKFFDRFDGADQQQAVLMKSES